MPEVSLKKRSLEVLSGILLSIQVHASEERRAVQVKFCDSQVDLPLRSEYNRQERKSNSDNQTDVDISEDDGDARHDPCQLLLK